jgi:hypothetical protein
MAAWGEGGALHTGALQARGHVPHSTVLGMSRVPAVSLEMPPWYHGARLPAQGGELNRLSSAYTTAREPTGVAKRSRCVPGTARSKGKRAQGWRARDVLE